MSKPNTQTKIMAIIAEQLGVDGERVIPTARFIEDFNADSLDVVELTMAIEEEFGLNIPDEEIENLKTVAELVAYVEGKMR